MHVFLIECSGSHWLAIARLMSGQHGITPVLWSGDAATVAAARAAQPDLIGIVGVEAACGRLPAQAAWPRQAVDASILSALAPDEAIALAMMDRMDPGEGAFDHDARRRHWHDLLRQWSGALDALQPDAVIFSMAPHAIYDYALYALCKQRGVPTCMFERAQLPGLVFAIERFETGSDEMRAVLRDLNRSEDLKLSDVARSHVAQLRGGGAGALPPNYRKKLERRRLMSREGRQRQAGILRTLAFELARGVYLALWRGAAPPNYFVREDSAGRLVSPGLAGWLRSRWRGQWKKRALRAFYDRLTRDVPAGRPYVLLTLHFQPERAIVPMAGAFCDQTLIVDLLAQCLPPDWVLVVKEHPWQLVPFGRGELGRSAGFYRRIADHPNVVFVPVDADTTALVRGARAVATATGSSGWQALACGIPALVFGAAWYADAPGVYRIGDVASCRDAMTAIAGGATVPADAAERMLAAFEAAACPGYLEPGLEDVALTKDEAAASMAAALAAILTKRVPEGDSRGSAVTA
jgi:hypothetical protein